MSGKASKDHSAEHIRRVRRRVAALVDGAAPKRLKDRQRLAAAAQVGMHVKLLREAGTSMSEICEYLGERIGAGPRSQSGEPFRLHRWMLKGGATEVTDNLVAQYKGRAEPLRSTAVYLQLLEHLALMAGREPINSQGALLTALDLSVKDMQPDDGMPLPEQRLAALMNEHAAVIARNLDLVRLFQRAERLQAGWNIKQSPAEVVDLATEGITGSFKSTEPTDRQYWLETSAPPLPTVPVARLPFGWLSGPFRLTNQAGDTQERPGQAVAYWELHLAIGPTGPLSVGAYLVRASSVDLDIDGHLFMLPDMQDDVEQIASGYPHAPKIDLFGDIWGVSCAAQPVYRTQRAGFDEDPPSETVPLLRMDPVSASSVRDWLMTPMDFVLDDGPLISAVDRLAPIAFDGIGWVRADSIARSLEIALRDGRLDEGFRRWLDQYLPALAQFEKDWLDRCLELDAALRARSAAGDLVGDE
ncbi:hypothetical protein [Rhodobacter sp. SY28-1]|uniref:hypothetical protein n=1 Tax=Rhodobacter sp. SY28-1 TaxID=2562317 RepID=UPI0010C08054|nr:hypothetical protein [Rhodobacter sp. SY28-1]